MDRKNPDGTNTIHEMILIIHIVTDEDGTLKIKKFETFHDPNVYLELRQATAKAAAAYANR
jgi:hypothetical protein